MISVHIIRADADAEITDALGLDLTARGFRVSSSAPRALAASSEAPGRTDEVLILILPHEYPTAASYEPSLATLRSYSEAGRHLLVLARSDDVLPGWLAQPRVAVQRTTGGDAYDRVFEGVLRYLLGPLPPSVELIARPSLLQSPAGATWWLQDLWVADDAFGHVVRIGPRGQGVALPGLDSPQQLHLDTTKLLVANKGADLIVRADVTPTGALSEIKRLVPGELQLLRPTAVHQARGDTIIADTDNHRVIVTSEDPWWRDVPWHVLESENALRFPSGVCVGFDHWWVADTFNRRILAAPRSRDGGRLRAVEVEEHDDPIFPVALTASADGQVLIVSDEFRKCVVFFRVETPSPDAPLRLKRVLEFGSKTAPSGGAAVPVGTPGGLSVNRDNRLAVADRQLACVWLIHLDAYEDELRR